MAAQVGGLLAAAATGLATSGWQAHAGERIALVLAAMTAVEILLCRSLLVLEPGDPPATAPPSPAADADLVQLGLKLLETFHLNVPERGRLPVGGVPLSALVAGVGARLAERGWFPASGLAEEELWTGARLERRGSELWTHERHEIGMMRVGPIRSKEVGSLEEAVRRFVEASGGSPLDGVHIDWSR